MIDLATFNVNSLIPYVRNSRTHSDEQIDQIAASITEFGFVNPILVGNDNVIIAGHGRLLAAQRLGITEVPVIMLNHLTETQRKALSIADNRIALNAGWDEALLRLELAELQTEDFNLELLGFNDQEIDNLLNTTITDETHHTDADAVPEVEETPVSKPGDLWLLGKHRLLCADATNLSNIDLLLDGELADMVFTDPPYNVDYTGKTKKQLKIQNDNLGSSFQEFLYDACLNLLTYCKGAVYICMSSSELATLQTAFTEAGGHWSTFIIWAKNVFSLGRSDYQRQYEPILYGWKEGRSHFWCGARNQGDVWHINKPAANDLHPTMKPIELVEKAINNSSQPNNIVLDCFGGSGSTLIACEKTGRQARIMELDPKYCDVIIKRWQDFTKKEALHKEEGRTFADLQKSFNA